MAPLIAEVAAATAADVLPAVVIMFPPSILKVDRLSSMVTIVATGGPPPDTTTLLALWPPPCGGPVFPPVC